ncbi:unnamed protein product [Amoebophrya sp. A25]|nr:unnamed protein product [Amoebophrya sp. A25]|eukprot:GSA25T00004475001.1
MKQRMQVTGSISNENAQNYTWSPYTTVVLDCGSHLTRAGFAGASDPQFVLPSVVSTYVSEQRKYNSSLKGATSGGAYGTPSRTADAAPSDLSYDIGQFAYEARHSPSFQVSHPIGSNGVEDWDSLERYWLQLFFKYLRVMPDDADVVLCEPPFFGVEFAKMATEVFFDVLGVNSLCLVPAPVCALHAASVQLSVPSPPAAASFGLVVEKVHVGSKTLYFAPGESSTSTGLVVDVGHRSTRLVPVVENMPLYATGDVFPFGGHHVTEYVHDCLQERKEEGVPPEIRHEVAEKVKVSQGYVAKELQSEFEKYDEQKFLHPDPHVRKESKIKVMHKHGRQEWSCDVGPERFLGPEIFFHPELYSRRTRVEASKTVVTATAAGGSGSGAKQGSVNNNLISAADAVIRKCPIDYRRQLYQRVVLVGGSSQFQHFSHRFTRELGLRLNTSQARKIQTGVAPFALPVMQRHAIWHGASIFAQTEAYKQKRITKEVYEEQQFSRAARGGGIGAGTSGSFGDDEMHRPLRNNYDSAGSCPSAGTTTARAGNKSTYNKIFS